MGNLGYLCRRIGLTIRTSTKFRSGGDHMMNDSQSINDILISFFQSAMTEKNITYRVLAQKMKCSEKTVFHTRPLLENIYGEQVWQQILQRVEEIKADTIIN